MKEWRVDYAYRKDGKYTEDSLKIIAGSVDGAIYEANSILVTKAWAENWDERSFNSLRERYAIWNVGVIMDADEEVI